MVRSPIAAPRNADRTVYRYDGWVRTKRSMRASTSSGESEWSATTVVDVAIVATSATHANPHHMRRTGGVPSSNAGDSHRMEDEPEETVLEKMHDSGVGTSDP